ncbi:MAG TPA: dienelactone hydrolase family protein [Thermoplasmata archaeon]|jgi:carboxymethylenebutenolidase|nr:dienelactone hydrolase family protein [Thermoplasmata archaeon]
MAVTGERLSYNSRGLDRPAYLARPPSEESRPGVVVIHEIFGLTPHIEHVARRLAEHGYVAFAPDLFAHGGRPVSDEELESAMRFLRTIPPEVRRDPAAQQARIGELPEAERGPTTRALDWLRNRDMDAYTPDMLAAVDFLSRQPFVRPDRIGSVGFCFGGALSVRLAAAGAPLAACIIFYGAAPPADRIPNIRGPVLGLYGGDDRGITDAVPAFAEAMRAAGKSFESHSYPGAGHAFFNDQRETYREEAARDAWQRTLAFFRQHLEA